MELFGVIAATLTTISFLPQTLKTIKDKDTSGISLGMYSIFTTGVFCWTIYGFIIGDLPIIIANVVTFIFALTILVMKLKYK
ncbi:MtN3 and saliva related transmembrane protein [Natranaerovirga pectinivora]|uniref:MtN3 and saliva related transmembrane protein n=1 Tax=Natranaerovirga pectinivora TaxID=682400 RepID=A0A4R3MKJ1_9FIRM|nr:SemiSWEET transporter [Natranaerovirga pectinivora]TCT14213.1 MtN3 and saliva related transmembrane protein [Natranaerovirga pectinivora]